jgi:soluble lytic murein transglycosylase
MSSASLMIDLFTTFAFAATASHSAAQPLVKSSPYLKALQNISYVDLEDLTPENDGWSQEDPETRKKILAQAENYLQYRRGGGRASHTAFVEFCLREPARNIFCAIEAQRVALHLEKKEAKDARRRSPHLGVVEMLRKGDLTALNQVDRGVLYHALNRFDNFAPLQPLADRFLKDKRCEASQVASALAFRAEDEFPDTKYITLARQLYEHAAECDGDKLADVTAHFRAAILGIWKGDCKQAIDQLAVLVQRPEADTYQSRASYWRHYCALQLKDNGVAKQAADDLWKNHPMSFQNLLVNGDDTRLAALLQEKNHPRVLFRSIMNSDLNDLVRAIEALLSLHANDMAVEVADVMSPQIANSESGFRLYIAALMGRVESGLPKFKILASLFHDQSDMLSLTALKMYFPLSHFDLLDSSETALDPYLVLSLIRQESAFNSRARSAAGARGLMQLMPATARQLGARSASALFDPKVNIRVGTKYLTHRLRNYDGDVELTLAAYNAGFARVDGWLKRYPSENRLLFLDLIPFRETRDYVSAIERNYYWYVQLYSKEPLKVRLAKNSKGPGTPIKMVALDETTTPSLQAH